MPGTVDGMYTYIRSEIDQCRSLGGMSLTVRRRGQKSRQCLYVRPSTGSINIIGYRHRWEQKSWSPKQSPDSLSLSSYSNLHSFVFPLYIRPFLHLLILLLLSRCKPIKTGSRQEKKVRISLVVVVVLRRAHIDTTCDMSIVSGESQRRPPQKKTPNALLWPTRRDFHWDEMDSKEQSTRRRYTRHSEFEKEKGEHENKTEINQKGKKERNKQVVSYRQQ